MAERITVIGDGAMGTVCALLLAQKGYGVTMWGHDAGQLAEFARARENTRFLPGVRVPPAVEFEADDAKCFIDTGLVVSAVPSKFLRNVWQRLSNYLPPNTAILSVTKGIENGTLLLPTQILSQLTGDRPIGALSGPNIASELARRLPATATVASADEGLTRSLQKIFSTAWFRVYRNNDILGVELAGATKNVIAIAAGIIDGMGLGDNAKAALLTRGLVEITRLGVACGARPETFAGLSGMGDLVTTCISPSGRNRTFGQAVGQGQSVADALAAIPGEVEGVSTCRSLVELARQKQVEMPITTSVYHILFEGRSVAETITELMTRRLKAEEE